MIRLRLSVNQRLLYKNIHMNQVIVELDDRTLKRLNQVAPPKARRRSDFVRAAILMALDDLAEQQMERAYRAKPQEFVEVDLDPATWEPVRVRAPRKKRKLR